MSCNTEFDVLKDVNIQMLSTIGELCHKLVEAAKSNFYPLINRVLRFVSTTTTKLKNKVTQQDGR